MLLTSLLFCAASLPAAAGPRMQFLGSFTWTDSPAWFGGLSGLEITADGQQLTVVSDRGWLIHAAITRSGGAVQGLSLRAAVPISHDPDLPNPPPFFDAEGLAIGADGRAYLALEHSHYLAELDLDTGQTRPLPRHPAFDGFPVNSGLEALAMHPDGSLYTLPERSGAQDRPFPLFRYADGHWQIQAEIPRRGPFLPVGADFGPDGQLYLLERAVTPLGFRSRIRRFDLGAADLAAETLISTGPGRFDNLEGLTVWRDNTGKIRLTMISDDNFLAIQSSQIVEYALTE